MSPTDWSAHQRNLIKIETPKKDGQRLSVPSLGNMDDLITFNGKQRAIHDCDIQGQPLLQLADQARNQLVAAAEDFTRNYCDVVTTFSSTPSLEAPGPLIITGHQPEIVHPGVWLKNFTAAHLAKRCHGRAIHLIIDSDLGRAPTIRVPTGSPSSPRTLAIPYDLPADCIPLEQRPWIDHSVWESFGARVHDAISPLVPDSMVRTWWSQIATPAAEAATIGLGLARARHLTEISWLSSLADENQLGNHQVESSQTLSARSSHTLEFPQSGVCQLPAFRRFTIHLLTQLPRFRNAYNRALANYRKIHKIRNHAQPVPDLTTEDGWLEAPFWIWSNHDPIRRPLLVRHDSAGLRLTDRHHFDQRLPVTDDGLPEEAIARLDLWEASGIKIRTRALITTLFARLLLSDLFIHGIGGAKYDWVTDEIAAQFYGFAPPKFLTLSGTLRLPFNQLSHESDISGRVDDLENSQHFELKGPGSSVQPQEIARTIREFTYHPELHINMTSINPSERHVLQELFQQKQRWIQTAKTPQNAGQRHRAIVAVNTALQPWLTSRREQLEKQRVSAQQRIAANHILQSREYAFCLFPVDHLQNFLLDFSSPMT